MYIPIPQQPDCASAWLEAFKAVDLKPNHEALNVIIDIVNPISANTRANSIVSCVEDFLNTRDKSVFAVANTIFPYAMYRRHGHPAFISAFHERVLPSVRLKQRWSGYYFERLTNLPTASGDPRDQLTETIDRINDPNNKALNKYELSLFDPERDVDMSPYGGQCLSHISLKRAHGTPGKLHMTAVYRNHYYTEKLLGNIIGLGRLLEYISTETDHEIGNLTIVSTHAVIDRPACNRAELANLIEKCGSA